MSDFNPFFNDFNAYTPELLGYEHAWVNFVKTGFINSSVIKPEIAQSWERCKMLGIDPLSDNTVTLINQDVLNRRIKERQNLIETTLPYLHLLLNLDHSSRIKVQLIDNEGYILSSLTDNRKKKSPVEGDLLPGTNMSEACMGTTSIGLAMTYKKPFQTVGAEHYLQSFHKWSCSSSPILSENKNLLGILSLSEMFEFPHPHTLGMIIATAKAIENELNIKQKNHEITNNSNQLKATLGAVSEGLVYVNAQGIITQINGVMEALLGIENSQIIGKEIEKVIKITPSLSKFLFYDVKINQKDVVLHGKQGNILGLLTKENIFDTHNVLFGTVFIFTKIDEIRKMASKIQKSPAYFHFENIIGQNMNLLNTIELAKKTAEFNSRVLIEGESGTGKELFAQAIHNASSRKNKPFVAINCGAMPRELVESELFGYEEGAFTGAKKGGHQGKFESANGGTIFLDEIGDMPMDIQVKILRVLQENRIMRIGGHYPIPIDVTIIAATNKNLEKEVEENRFREDLFYRLNVFNIKIPALRERKDDIPMLVKHFINKFKFGTNEIRISKEVMEILQNYSWPGNIRQLQNVLERTVMMTNKPDIFPNDLPLELLQDTTGTGNVNPDITTIKTLEEMSKVHVLNTLAAVNNNISTASKLLDVSRNTIYRFIEKKKFYGGA